MLAAVAVMLPSQETETSESYWPGCFQQNRRHGYARLPDGDDLTEVHLHVVDLGNKDGRQRLVQSRAVHVDGGADRQHEARDPLVDAVVLLQTLEGDGQRGGAGRRHGQEKRFRGPAVPTGPGTSLTTRTGVRTQLDVSSVHSESLDGLDFQF